MQIKIEELDISLGKCDILKDISVVLDTNEITMVIGLNGSGKTTLLKTILGLYKPQKGLILYDDIDIHDMSIKARSKQVGYLPQSLDTAIEYTVFDFIVMGSSPYLSWYQKPTKKQIMMVDDLLLKYNILYLRDRSMLSLSGGERQLVYFLQVQMQQCSYIVMDEPIAMLDYVRQHEFFKTLQIVLKRSKQGVLMSVHDPNLVLEYAQRVLVMHDGLIVGDFSRADAMFVEALHACLVTIYGDALQFKNIEGKDICLWRSIDEY